METAMMSLHDKFQEYFDALDRAGNEDRCFLCRRSPAEVKVFFGFQEDGTPIDAESYGIEDVTLDHQPDIMSYRGTRPVCAVCQLNFDAIFMAGNGHAVLRRVLRELEQDRDRLWDDDQPRR
ncbi:MAG: hypothetical protein ACI8QS_000963 [Planctomycetota bacterium]|jgi:hypothetical protein